METIGERIFKRRAELNMTQQHVADKVGVTRVAVTKWESGQTENLKLGNLMGLCKLLNVSIEYLIQGGDVRSYGAANVPNQAEEAKEEFGIKTEGISLLRTQVHQEVSRIPEKDLPQVRKILSTYDGIERRSKPRKKQESNSNK